MQELACPEPEFACPVPKPFDSDWSGDDWFRDDWYMAVPTLSNSAHHFFMITNLIGYCATVVGSLLLLPQVIKSYKTRRVHDLSFFFIVLYALNCFLWLIYGFLIAANPIVIANFIGLCLCMMQLVFKLKFRGKGENLI